MRGRDSPRKGAVGAEEPTLAPVASPPLHPPCGRPSPAPCGPHWPTQHGDGDSDGDSGQWRQEHLPLALGAGVSQQDVHSQTWVCDRGTESAEGDGEVDSCPRVLVSSHTDLS